EDYARRHPELADDIRELFPTILAVERAKHLPAGSGHELHAGYEPPLGRLGDFRIVRELGRGGMGIVYEAEQESLGRRVAIKVLPRQHAPDPKRRVRFEREARTAAKLHHTNIVPIFGVGEQDDYRYFVMQYIRGVGMDVVFRALSGAGVRAASSSVRTPGAASRTGDLVAVARELLKENGGNGSTARSEASTLTASLPSAGEEGEAGAAAAIPTGRTPGGPAPTVLGDPPAEPRVVVLNARYWRDLALLMAQAADALAYAHSQNVLHRDVKPSNLLLDAGGTLWVADFGLAKAIEHEELTQAGDVIGTLRYMAPEQFKNQVDARSDVYSLGVTLYELATLRPAFAESKASALIQAILEKPLTPPRLLCPSMPRDLETIILKSTAREPAHRYATAAMLRDDLRRFAEDRPILARRVSPVERLRRWAGRNPALATMTLLSFALLAAVAAVSSAAYFNVRGANDRTQKALEGETRERRRAQEQRQRAQETADLAVEALDAIFNEFAPESVLSAQEISLAGSEGYALSVPPVISRETASFLEHMLEYYRRLGGQEAASAFIQRKAADAQKRVGEIHERLGHREEAEAAYAEAIEQYERLRAGAPDDAGLQAALAQAHNLMASLLFANRQPREAGEHLDAARKVLRPMYERGSATPEVQFEYARTLYLSAGLGGGGMMFGAGPGAGPRAGSGRGPWPGEPSALGSKPAEPGARPEGRGYRGPPDDPDEGPGRRGRGGPGRGPPGPGRGPREGAGPPGERRPDGGPGGPIRLLGPRLRDWPSREEFEERRRQERADLQEAVKILTRLSEQNPQIPQYRHLMALCLRKIPPALPAFPGAGMPGSQRGELDQAVEILEALAADNRFRRIPQYRFDLADTYVMQSLFARGPESCDRLSKAVALMNELVNEQPHVPGYQVLLAKCLMMHAKQHCEAEPEAEIENLSRAVELQEKLAVQFPETALVSATFQAELARALLKRGRHQQARDLLRKAVATAEEADEDEFRPGPRWVIADLYTQLAEAHEGLHEPQKAQEARQKAARFRERFPQPQWSPSFGGPPEEPAPRP
ncbi:MAG: serine/threonine protein kinase, partial [Phycisphaerae bacterium]